MFKSFADQLSHRMMWCLVAAITCLTLTLASMAVASTRLIWNADHIHANVAGVEFEATITKIRNEIDSNYTFMTQQQLEMQNISKKLEKISSQITKAQQFKASTPSSTGSESITSYEIMQKNLSKIPNDLSNAISDLKNQSKQIDTQKAHLKSLNNELTQLTNKRS